MKKILFTLLFALLLVGCSNQPISNTNQNQTGRNCNDLSAETQKSLDTLMSDNNYCVTNSDCLISYKVKTGMPCPCYELLNKNASLQNINESAQKITSNYIKNCVPSTAVYNCPACIIFDQSNIKCVNKKCVVSNVNQIQTGCNTNSDCQNGASCMVEGPLIADQPIHKVCVPKGQVVPL